jgi:DNA (cytosine-5)-methyltransferase 1
MRILDLFCGAGGAAMGLHRACPDAEIVGVDIKPQPRYPFTFVQTDAMTYALEGFDFIWASPPCQHYCALKTMKNRRPHPALIEPVRQLLQSSGNSWVIENVFGAPLLDAVMLCGSHFGLQSNGFQLRRHRYFESNFHVTGGHICQHGEKTLGVYGAKVRDIAQEKRHYAKSKATRGEPIGVVLPQKWGFEAMRIDWMTIAECSEAIPPAYSEYIMHQYLASVADAPREGNDDG